MTQIIMKILRYLVDLFALLTIGGFLTLAFATCGLPTQYPSALADLLFLGCIFIGIRLYLTTRLRRELYDHTTHKTGKDDR